MDSKSKSMNWVANIWQKFEEVCIEMEDKLCKEAKFVESHVQTVGVNVNKFFAEVVQDLLPSSCIPPAQGRVSGSSVVKDADVIHEALIEREPSDKESGVTTSGKSSCQLLNSAEESVFHDVDGLLSPSSVNPSSDDSSVHNINDLLPPSPGNTVRGGGLLNFLEECNVLKISELTTADDCYVNCEHAPCLFEGVRNQATFVRSPQNTIHLDCGASGDPDEGVGSNLFVKENDILKCEKSTVCQEETTINLKQPPDASVLSAMKEKSAPSLSSELSEMNHEKPCAVPLVEKVPLTDSVKASAHASSPHSRDNVALDSVFDDWSSFSSHDLDPPLVPDEDMEPGLPLSRIILPRESTVRTGSSDDNAIESCINSIELFDNAKLGDSCIVVDKEVSFVPPQALPQRSLKKMLKHALASRMRSTKQREYEQLAISYEQLAISYGDINADNNPARESSTSNIPATDLQLKTLSESDWELV